MTEEYERGFVDGAQHQMKSSVDLALEAMRIKKWIGLNSDDMKDKRTHNFDFIHGARWAEKILMERNT